MYWPCGVPRVYAYRGLQQRSSTSEAALDRDVGPETWDESNEKIRDEPEEKSAHETGTTTDIVGLCVADNDLFFASITRSTLTIWQTRPPVVLAAVIRSSLSLQKYGEHENVFFRADCSLVAIQTSLGYLLIYSIEADPQVRVYQQHYESAQTRRQSSLKHHGVDDTVGFQELIIRLKQAIKVDAGINAVLPLPNEVVVATSKPPAIQCLNWSPIENSSQPRAELLSKMEWIQRKSVVMTMVHNRAMHLFIWISDDGRAYAVQRQSQKMPDEESSVETKGSEKPSPGGQRLFRGHCFHKPATKELSAIVTAVNAKFSLLTVGCQNGELLAYGVKDYAGNISLSHKIPAVASPTTTGKLTCMMYSPDGYYLFVGYEKGWATWSVFGKPGISSFGSSIDSSDKPDEGWLRGVLTANWTAGGGEILLTAPGQDKIWKLEFSRSAAAGCFSCANLVRALFQTQTEVKLYRGHDLPDLTSISGEASLWHHAQFPAGYIHKHGPIKCSVVSQDGRYVAIAGRRGLAHYSVQSRRWKTFANPSEESAFTVRGGMCWFNHVLIAATESDGSFEIRAYAREAPLSHSNILCLENLPGSIVFLGPSGEDSLLVYSSENILYHFVISFSSQAVALVQVGQIAFHGVVRAPTRVRSVSWILPESQLRNGDPSQDVALASVLFLVDDKLVLLQPSRTEAGDLRYDMRIVAQHIEFYILMRDQLFYNFASSGDESIPPTPSSAHVLNGAAAENSLRDSLWAFSGNDLRMWTDVRDVLRMALEGPLNEGSSSLSIPIDFYPLSILLNRGIVLGIESELVQRRDLPFSQLQTRIRTNLFIPYILQHLLSIGQDVSTLLALARQYEHLSYFPHVLEILLHNVLDSEAETPGKGRRAFDQKSSTIPGVLSLLYSSLSESSYLSTIIQCIRKTEITSWPVVLAHLPPPAVLFEQALQLDELKTATGCLMILQNVGEDDDDGEDESRGEEDVENHVMRLMTLAKESDDWELCSELARFLMSLDPMGHALRRVVEAIDFQGKQSPKPDADNVGNNTGLGLSFEEATDNLQERSVQKRTRGSVLDPTRGDSPRNVDYFSSHPGA